MTDDQIIEMANELRIRHLIDDTTIITSARLLLEKQKEIDAERIEAVQGEWLTKVAASALIKSQK